MTEDYEKGKGSPAGSSAASWLKRNAPKIESVTWRLKDEDGNPTDQVKVAFFEDGE